MFSTKMLADSINVAGNRLSTYELVYEEFIHNELMTHRDFSRNAMSSRAIPVEKIIAMVENDPVIPIEWARNKRGMQGGDLFTGEDAEECREIWLSAARAAREHAGKLAEKGVHKQTVNRLLQPYKWISTIVSATEYWNFFALRTHRDAEPHMRRMAERMLEQYDASTPALKEPGEWHLPLVYEWDIAEISRKHGGGYLSKLELAKISSGRCARVSYLTHHGTRDLDEDIRLYNDLSTHDPMHASPLEHPAEALGHSSRIGNYHGWRQYRKMHAVEYIDRDRRVRAASS